MTRVFLSLFSALAPLLIASADPVRSGAVEVELVTASDTIVAGEPFTAAIRVKTGSHWHVYWKNPGDSGTPVKVSWTLPDGATAGELQFPAPKVYDTAGFITYGHEGEFFLIAKITPPATLKLGDSFPIAAKVNWLACDPSRCVPGRAELTSKVKVAAIGNAKPNKWTRQIEAAAKSLPIPATKATASIDGTSVIINVSLPDAPKPVAAQFFPAQSGLFKHNEPKPAVTIGDDGTSATITLQRDGDEQLPKQIEGVLAFEKGKALSVLAPIKS